MLSVQVSVSIVDDNLLERPEIFFGTLMQTESSAMLASSVSNITIVDNDGNYKYINEDHSVTELIAAN